MRLYLVHTVEATVEAALFLASELMLLELLSPELFLAHRVREVAVATSEAASVPVALLSSWWACIRHRNVGSASAWVTSWRVFWSGLVARVGEAAMGLRAMSASEMVRARRVQHVQLLRWELCNAVFGARRALEE